MYMDNVTESLKNSIFFNRLLLKNDYVICMYVAGQRLFDKDYDGDYDIVVVTGNTTRLRTDEMLMYGDKKIRWIYLSLKMFTTFREYFKYNYLSHYEFNDVFLYSIYFVGDNTIFYSNPDYMSKLTELYAVKKSANIKKFIRYTYQYNEELLNKINSDNIEPVKDYLYHFLIMSYIMNNEALSVKVIDNIKALMSHIRNKENLSMDEKKYINDRISLFRTMCK